MGAFQFCDFTLAIQLKRLRMNTKYYKSHIYKRPGALLDTQALTA